MNILDKFHKLLVDAFGFNNAIRIEDSITYFSGIILGVMLGVFLVTYFGRMIKHDYELDPEVAVMYVPEKKAFVANPSSIMNYIDTLVVVISWKLFRDPARQQYILLRDMGRVRWLIGISAFIAAFVVFIGTWFTVDIINVDEIINVWSKTK